MRSLPVLSSYCSWDELEQAGMGELAPRLCPRGPVASAVPLQKVLGRWRGMFPSPFPILWFSPPLPHELSPCEVGTDPTAGEGDVWHFSTPPHPPR